MSRRKEKDELIPKSYKITQRTWELGNKLSSEIFGNSNMSRLISYLIEKEAKRLGLKIQDDSEIKEEIKSKILENYNRLGFSEVFQDKLADDIMDII